MKSTGITPLLVSESDVLEAWLERCIQEARPYPFAPLRVVSTVGEVGDPDHVQPALAFIDLLDSEGQLAERLSQMRALLAPLPLIALVTSHEQGSEALSLGAHDYLVPDETDGALLSRVVRYLFDSQPEPAETESAGSERFQTYLENAPDIIYIFDLTANRIIYANRDHLFGYSAGELRQPGSLLSLVYEGDQAAVNQHFEQLKRASTADVFVYEYRLQHKNGSREWVQSRETVLRVNDQGVPTQILVSLSVITHRREREAAVRRYAERLQILHEIDQAIVSARSPQAIAQAALRRISRLIPSHRASVTIFDWNEETFSVLAEVPEGATGSNDTSPLPLSWFWATGTLRQGETYRADNIHALGEEEQTPMIEWLGNQGVHSIVSVPLLAQRQLIGALNFGARKGDHFTAEDIVVMREVAHVLAIAIGQARLYEQVHYHARKLEQRARRLLLVNDISLAVNRPIELEAVLEAATRGLGTVIDVRQVGVALLNETRDTWTLLSSYAPRTGRAWQEVSLPVRNKEAIQQLWQSDSVVFVRNMQDNPSFEGLERILQSRDIHNLALLPLQVREEVIGVIGCDLGMGARPISREETELIQTIANLLAIKVEQIRLLEAERQARAEAENHAANLRLRERHLTLLNAITRATTGLEPQEMLQTVIDRLSELSAADGCYITLWDSERNAPRPAVAGGSGSGHYELFEAACGDPSLTRVALEQGRPVTASDAALDLPAAPDSVLAVPLAVGKEKLGALIICFDGSYSFSEAEVNLYEQVAGQIAVALSAARLFEETRRQLEELRVLHALATAGAEARDEDWLIERATMLMEQAFFADNFGVLLYDEAQDILCTHHSYRSGRYEKRQVHIPLSRGICGYVAKTGKAVRLGDVSEEPRYVAADPLTRSELCVPLRSGNRLLGVVNAESEALNAFSASHERLLLTFAHQLATALEKLRLLQAERQRRREAEAVSEVLRALNATPNVREALSGVATALGSITGSERVTLALINDDRDAFSVLTQEGDNVHPQPQLWYPLESTPASQDILSGQVHLTPDLSTERDGTVEKLLYQAGQRSRMNLPLRVDDVVIGALNLTWSEKEGYDEAQLPLLSQIASAVALAVERSRLFAQTHRRAEELEVLSNLSATLRVADGVSTIVENVLLSSIELFSADMAAIAVPEPDGQGLKIAYNVGVPQVLLSYSYPLDESIFGHVFSSGRPYLTPDVFADPMVHASSRQVWQEADQIPRGAIFAPLRAGAEIIGIVSVFKTTVRSFEEEDLRLLNAMAEIAGNALQRAGLMETLEQRVVERTRELAEANEQLKELDRLKSKFVSDISHELRTPITSLSLYLDLIERGNPEHAERYWGVLRKQTDRLNQLIEDILSLSRLQMGKIDFKLRPVDLNELVHEALTVYEERFEGAGVEVQFQPQQMPPVLAHAEQLFQVIVNLLSNALNYTPEGRVSVSTEVDEAAHSARLTIQDSGVGISEDDLPHIFERFYRGQYASQSNIPGTGLGLTIVREIIHLHNGEIEVESERDVGTTFRVHIPLSPSKSESPAQPLAPSG
jgi:PAS domain S-box-containing protein